MSSSPSRTGDAIENPMLRSTPTDASNERAYQREAQAYGLFVSQFLYALGEPDALLTPFNGGPDEPLQKVVYQLLTEYVSDKECAQFMASLLLIAGQTAQGKPCALMAQGTAHALAHAYASEATQQAAERGDLPQA